MLLLDWLAGVFSADLGLLLLLISAAAGLLLLCSEQYFAGFLGLYFALMFLLVLAVSYLQLR